MCAGAGELFGTSSTDVRFGQQLQVPGSCCGRVVMSVVLLLVRLWASDGRRRVLQLWLLVV